MTGEDSIRKPKLQEPPSDLFVAEGEDRCWAWAGNHSRKEAIAFARNCHGIEGKVNAYKLRGNIEMRPGEVSESEPWLVPTPDGEYEFWMVEAGSA